MPPTKNPISERISFVVSDTDAGKRMDVVVTDYMKQEHDGITRSRIASWIEQGLVEVGGAVVEKASLKLPAGASVTVGIPLPQPTMLEPDAGIPIDAIFEDESVLVLSKPAGVVIHPLAQCF